MLTLSSQYIHPLTFERPVGAMRHPQITTITCLIKSWSIPLLGLTTKRLALLKLRICKALVMALSLKYTYVDHIPCWVTEILSCALICMQMSHANFKITKKDLELISRIKGRVRQPWLWDFPGSRILLFTKKLLLSKGWFQFPIGSNQASLCPWRDFVWWQFVLLMWNTTALTNAHFPW